MKIGITSKRLRVLLVIALGTVMLGCSQALSPGSTPTDALPGETTQITPAHTPTTTTTPLHTLTATIPPTSTRSPLPSSTPIPTATPPHPLTIAYLRQQEYPVGKLTIEEVLEPGVNHQRYIASYRSEGLKIHALLTVPDGERPASGWPVIIFNHGYIPPDQYRTTELYVSHVNTFAQHGYIVLRPDYRGHAFSEGSARGAYGYPDYTIDVLNALAAIKNYPEADPQRIGMWGHSMGGYITLRAMVVSQDILAGVIWAGVVAPYEDLLRRWRRLASASTPPANTASQSWSNSLVAAYGDPQTNPTFWDSISANSYLQDLSGPLQLQHGSADSSVPVEYSSQLANQVRAAGGYVELYIYDSDDHNLLANFGQAMLRSLFFFDKHVKGDG